MHTSFQKKTMERLSDIRNEKTKILEKFECYETGLKAKMVEYIINKYVYRKNWKRDYVYKNTGLNKDGIRNFKNPYIITAIETFFKFVFGIGCESDDAIFLALECNIDIMGDNDIAKANLEILNMLDDEKFQEECGSYKIAIAIEIYHSKMEQLIKTGQIRKRKKDKKG